MPSFQEGFEQAKQFWASRTVGQQRMLMAGAAATLVLLGLFVRLIGTPDYQPLSTGLEAADAQALTAQLDAQGIPHQISADGKTVSVPADQLAAARMQTASQGAPHSGRTGFELFDKMSWGETEFDEKVTYQRALEGELERSIETLSDVKSARVHLVMPTDSVFADQQRTGKASVIVKLRGNGLSKDAIQAISRLVSSAVDQMKPEDVSIVDADSDRALGIGHEGDKDGEGLEATLTQRLISTLTPVAGLDQIRASVNVDHDPGSSEESDEKYDPSVSVLLRDQKSMDQANKASTSGVPGAASNVPTSAKAKTPAVTGPDTTQTSTSETAEYGVNRVVMHRVVPAGRIRRVTAAILVDDAVVRNVQGGKVTFTRRKRTQDELNKIQELAEAAIGFDPKRGDSVSVQNMSFDSNASDTDLAADSWSERLRKALTDYGSLVRPVALLALFVLAYLFVLRPIQKQALGAPQPAMALQPALGPGVGHDALQPAPPELGEGTQRATLLKEQTVDLIKQKPANTTRAVQAWLREDPS